MAIPDTLNAAADAIQQDKHTDALTRSVGQWLRAEALMHQAMEPMVELFNVALEQVGGPKSYLRLGKREDGEIKMEADTNEPALQVAAEVLRRYGIDQ